MTRKKSSKMKLIPMALYIIVGGLSGYLLGYLMGSLNIGGGPLATFILFIVSFVASFYIQMILHEAGHLVFGLLSGYRFSSFRIGNTMLLRTSKGWSLKRMKLAGTGGQCLMIPPELVEGRMPIVAYNLGGVIMNLITASIALAILLLMETKGYLFFFLIVFSAAGILIAILNGVPLKLGLVDNDGYNTLSLKRSKKALRAFWIQLKINQAQSEGVRLKDMPSSWFDLPDESDMGNTIISALAVFNENRLMDEQRFEEAEALIKKLLDSQMISIGLYEKLLIADFIYIEAITTKSKEVIDKLYNKEQAAFMKAMKSFPSVIRTEYALALLNNDERNRDEALKRFERISKTYPNPSDIVSEGELIKTAEAILGKEDDQ